MSRVRLPARVDANQAAIVEALRLAGCRVQSLAEVGRGCPDLLVWHKRTGLMLLEVKVGRAKLTPAEESWHFHWTGAPVFVVRSAVDALELLEA